jgi:hypothetical protein
VQLRCCRAALSEQHRVNRMSSYQQHGHLRGLDHDRRLPDPHPCPSTPRPLDSTQLVECGVSCHVAAPARHHSDGPPRATTSRHRISRVSDRNPYFIDYAARHHDQSPSP